MAATKGAKIKILGIESIRVAAQYVFWALRSDYRSGCSIAKETNDPHGTGPNTKLHPQNGGRRLRLQY